MKNVLLWAFLLSIRVIDGTNFEFFTSCMQADVLLAHFVVPSDMPALLQQDGSGGGEPRPHFACGPLRDLHAVRRAVELDTQHGTSTAFVSKKEGKGCILAFSTPVTANKISGGSGMWKLEAVPQTLKIHSTALFYLQQLDLRHSRMLGSAADEKGNRDRRQDGHSPGRGHGRGHTSRSVDTWRKKPDKDSNDDIHDDFPNDNEIMEHEILIEFVRAAVNTGVSSEYVKDVWKSLIAGIEKIWGRVFSIDKRLTGKPWNKLVQKYLVQEETGGVVYPPECAALITSVNIAYRSHSVVISGISHLAAPCIASILHAAAAHPAVLRIAAQPLAQLVNFEARGIMQGGSMGQEPYREAGLEGQGQICGVADSGLNDLSCFFIDNSGAYPTITTNRSGVVEPLRRKVVQYVPHADDLDEEGGHGTHVCGTVAGSSLQEFGQMSGMAPQAKIAFFDIGITSRDYLKLPALEDIFDTAYSAGARVHTNSWGNLGGLYGQMSYDVDTYTYAHPDFMVVFAAGNSGDLGGKSIIAPGNAKNALSVGAAQLRTVLGDEPRSTFNQNTALAYFSSLGPTFDGRLKPDVIAPGDFIESAFSGPPELLRAAIDEGPDWNGHESCAVHQMSGTSMAAPGAAGVALLVRQYFMDENFWATTCNKAYKRCKDGAFAPSGFLLKGLFLHSGNPMQRYSDPMYDAEGTALDSFELTPPPNNFEGHGLILLKNLLPLRNKKGLHPDLELVVFDDLELAEHSTLSFDIVLNAKEVRENRPIKVTISWYDPPSLVGSAASLLLHDLDLAVYAPNGELFLGNRGARAFSLPSMTYSEAKNPTETSTIDVRGLDEQMNSTASTSPTPQEPNIILDADFLDENTDFANPNEQVFIAHPQCFTIQQQSQQSQGGGNDMLLRRKNPSAAQSHLSCVYRVYIHANTLTEYNSQKFAAVFTIPRSAVLHGPVVTNTWVRVPEKPLETFSPTPAFTVANLDFSAKLAGQDYDKFSVYVPFCTTLQRVEVWVSFEGLGITGTGGDAWPSNMELTIVTPAGDALAIGGVDSSLGLSTKITEWPDSWIDSKAGNYYASIAAKDAGLAGNGEWKVYVMNSYSASGMVWYNATVVLSFSNAVDSNSAATCAPTLQPTPKTTVSPSFPPTRSVSANAKDLSSNSQTHTHAIHFTDIGLLVRQSPEDAEHDNKMHIHSDATSRNEGVQLDAFNFTGSLESVAVRLDGLVGSVESRGTNSWFFTLTVSDSRGLEVQVGGYEWLAQRDRFYCRRWPEPWVGQESHGRTWTARRDVHAAGLIGCREPSVYSGSRRLTEGEKQTQAASKSLACPSYIKSTVRGNTDEWYIAPDAEEGGQWVPVDSRQTPEESTKSKRTYGGGEAAGFPVLSPSIAPSDLITPRIPRQLLRHRNSDWVVRAVLGYPWGNHQPVNFSGTVYLTFRTTAASTAPNVEPAIFDEDSWNGRNEPLLQSGSPSLAPLPRKRPTKDGFSNSTDSGAHGRSGGKGLHGSSEMRAREAVIWHIFWLLTSIWIIIAVALTLVFASWCAPVRRWCLCTARLCGQHAMPLSLGSRVVSWAAFAEAEFPENSAHGLLGAAEATAPKNATLTRTLSQGRRAKDGYGSINI